jgi:hypothetical protein
VIGGLSLVGVIARADLAAHLPEANVGDLVQEISEPE